MGISPQGKVNRTWSPELAYAIGLIVTDGCLYNDRRHINLTSNDLPQLRTFMKCLNIKNKISYKTSGYTGKRSPQVQFGDILFYEFLNNIGIYSAKTKTIKAVKIPDKYIFDFLRGHFDGDGTFYSYWDKRWKSSFMFYSVFISASPQHLQWIREVLKKRLNIKGHMTHGDTKSVYNLKYAKVESLQLLRAMYYATTVPCLKRKRDKIKKALKIAGYKL